ncbi:MAG: hypothetical protein MI920_09120 [Kiloniellales bacterium]|nr:hypothetical protein [Kiloniellales bacterium]
MAFQAFLDRIKNAGQDLASIDVVTVSGNIEVKLAGDKIDFKNMVKSIHQNVAKTTGTVHIVAFTHIDFDKDAVNFVKSGLTPEETPLISAHNDMVKTANEARLAVVNFVKGLIS